MNKVFSNDDIKHRPFENINADDIKESAKQEQMKEIVMAYDPKDLNEVGFALAKVFNSIKASVDDDGKLTAGDAIHFIDDAIPLFNAFTGIQNIPKNIAAITDEQKAAFKQEFLDELKAHPKDENAADTVIEWIFGTLSMLIAFGVLKPEIEKPEV